MGFPPLLFFLKVTLLVPTNLFDWIQITLLFYSTFSLDCLILFYFFFFLFFFLGFHLFFSVCQFFEPFYSLAFATD